MEACRSEINKQLLFSDHKTFHQLDTSYVTIEKNVFFFSKAKVCWIWIKNLQYLISNCSSSSMENILLCNVRNPHSWCKRVPLHSPLLITQRTISTAYKIYRMEGELPIASTSKFFFIIRGQLECIRSHTRERLVSRFFVPGSLGLSVYRMEYYYIFNFTLTCVYKGLIDTRHYSPL